MRIPIERHAAHDFRVHQQTRGCVLLDLWESPIAGTADDFPEFLRVHDLEAKVAETSAAVYARPKGRLGRAYLRAIAPFRHRLVYPALMEAGRRRWERRHVGDAPGADQK